MKLLKNKWVVLVVGVISLALAIIMLPSVTNLGQDILYSVTAVAFVIYAIAFLLKNVSKRTAENVAFWFEAFEIIIVFLLAVGLVLTQFNIFQINDVSLVVALVIWLRGIVGAIRGRTKLSHLVGFLALTTVGTYFFAKPLVGETSILTAISVIFFVLALVCAIKFYEIHKSTPAKPKKNKVKAKVEAVEEPEEDLVLQQKENKTNAPKKENKKEEE